MRKISILYIIPLIFFSYCVKSSHIDFTSQGAKLKIKSGATFHVNKVIDKWEGTLDKEDNGTISGTEIVFTDGILKNAGNELTLSATFDPDVDIVYLRGNDTFKAGSGRLLSTRIVVEGEDNRLEGSPSFINDVLFTDASTGLTVAAGGSFNVNILLNGGRLRLDNNIKFKKGHWIVGPGTIDVNDNLLELGEGVTFTQPLKFIGDGGFKINSKTDLSTTFSFAGGLFSITGNGNILDFTDGGIFYLDSGTTVSIAATNLKHLNSQIDSLVFIDNTSRIAFSSATLEFDNSFNTTVGGIIVDGPTTFALDGKTWTIDTAASLTVDSITLWIDGLDKIHSGGLAFGAFQPSFLSLINSGTIKRLANSDTVMSNTTYLQEQLDDDDLLITYNSNAIVATNSLAEENSAAILGGGSQLAIDNSNAILELENDVGENSSAIVATNSLAEENSAAILSGGSQLAIDNSNAIIGLEDDVGENSAAIILLDSRVTTNEGDISSNQSVIISVNALALANQSDIAENSNAIIATNNLAKENSAAILAVDPTLTQQNSAAILSLEADIEENSNAILSVDPTLQAANSNAIVALDVLTDENSSAIKVAVPLVEENSAAILAVDPTLQIANSNAIVGLDILTDENSSAIKVAVPLGQENSAAIVATNNLAEENSAAILVVDPTLQIENSNAIAATSSLADENSSAIVVHETRITTNEGDIASNQSVIISVNAIALANQSDIAENSNAILATNNLAKENSAAILAVDPTLTQQNSAAILSLEADVAENSNAILSVDPTLQAANSNAIVALDVLTDENSSAIKIAVPLVEENSAAILAVDPTLQTANSNAIVGLDVLTDENSSAIKVAVPLGQENSAAIVATNNLAEENSAAILVVDPTLQIENSNAIAATSRLADENSSAIVVHETRITTNEGDIASNQSVIISVNALALANQSDIAENSNAIKSHDVRIAANETVIDENSSAILALEADIAENSNAILSVDPTLAQQNSAAIITLNSSKITLETTDINLNSGTSELTSDLILAQDTMYTGIGTVQLNQNMLTFGHQDLSWTSTILWEGTNAEISFNSRVSLSSTWSFSGAMTINGNGNILDLAAISGQLVVFDNTTLKLKDMVVEGVIDNKIRCLGDSSTIILENVGWLQSGLYTFTKGAMQFKEMVVIDSIGAQTFAYQTNQTSTVCSNAELKLDSNLTFSYDARSGVKTLIEFEDDTGQITLNGSTLYVTATGIQFLNGKVVIQKTVTTRVENRPTGNFDEGVTFGDKTVANDCVLEIAEGALLYVEQGSLYYRNVSPLSLIIGNKVSSVRVESGASFIVLEDFDIGEGSLTFKSGSTLGRAIRKDIIGPVHIEGGVTYKTFGSGY